MPARYYAAAAAGLLCALATPTLAHAQTQTQETQTARGQALLARYHCGSCHLIPGVPAARSNVAVTLEAFGRRSYIAGRVANTPEMLARWISQPQAVVPGTLMPDLGVSAADAHDIAAYLGTLR